jgi:hypothetical protein
VQLAIAIGAAVPVALICALCCAGAAMLAVRRYRRHKDQDDDDEERNDDIDASLQSIVALTGYSGAHESIAPVSKKAAAASVPLQPPRPDVVDNPLYVPNAFFVTNELAHHASQVPTNDRFPFTV